MKTNNTFFREDHEILLGGIFVEESSKKYCLSQIIPFLKTLLLAVVIFNSTPAFAKTQKKEGQVFSSSKELGKQEEFFYGITKKGKNVKSIDLTHKTNNFEDLKNFPKFDQETLKLKEDVINLFTKFSNSNQKKLEKNILVLNLPNGLQNGISIISQNQQLFLQKQPRKEEFSAQEKKKWTKQLYVIIKWFRDHRIMVITILIGLFMIVFYYTFKNIKFFNSPNGNLNIIPEPEKKLRDIKERVCSIRKLKLEKYQKKYESFDKRLKKKADLFLLNGQNMYKDKGLYNEKANEITNDFKYLLNFKKTLEKHYLDYEKKCN